MCEVRHSDLVEFAMVQKIIDVAGSSPASFAKAAENAVASAAETVRNLKWARVSELEMELEGKKGRATGARVRNYLNGEGEGPPARVVQPRAFHDWAPYG